MNKKFKYMGPDGMVDIDLIESKILLVTDKLKNGQLISVPEDLISVNGELLVDRIRANGLYQELPKEDKKDKNVKKVKKVKEE